MPNPTYVSTSGTLTQQPLTTRLANWATGPVEIAYLFFETLMSPILNPASWNDPSAGRKPSNPAPKSGGSGGGGGGGDGNGRGGGGGGGGNGRGGGGGGGFMSMGDMRGGGTVDGCRATCG